MDLEFAQLVHTLTELTKVEAFYRDHSEGSCEVGKDSLRIAHETCQTALSRVEIRLAETGVCIFHFQDFILADTSAQGKSVDPKTPSFAKDGDIQGDGSQSVGKQIPNFTKDGDIQGDGSQSVGKQIPNFTKDGDIQGDGSQSVGKQIPNFTKDGDIQGDANKSIEQPVAQEQDPISTEDNDNQGEAYVSIFGDGPLYPHCVEADGNQGEAAIANAQQMSPVTKRGESHWEKTKRKAVEYWRQNPEARRSFLYG